MLSSSSSSSCKVLTWINCRRTNFQWSFELSVKKHPCESVCTVHCSWVQVFDATKFNVNLNCHKTELTVKKQHTAPSGSRNPALLIINEHIYFSLMSCLMRYRDILTGWKGVLVMACQVLSAGLLTSSWSFVTKPSSHTWSSAGVHFPSDVIPLPPTAPYWALSQNY